MTTTKTFGITRPGDNIQHTQFNQPAQQNIDEQKFKILSEAIQKFMNKEITQEELKIIQDSLK